MDKCEAVMDCSLAKMNGSLLISVKKTTPSIPREKKCARFFKKYFWEGQKLNGEHSEGEEVRSSVRDFVCQHRKLFGLLIPTSFFTVCWWMLAVRYNFFQYFPTKYFMSITMAFGATIAGATSEGGAAVAFPVMTLAFNITPSVARDFCIMIQTCGMSAAAFTILWMNLQLELHAIIFCTFGSCFGLVFGFYEVDARMSAGQKKMTFVCVSFALAIALFVLNREKKRRTFNMIIGFNWHKAFILVVTGFVGGAVTAVTGSGVDICAFCVLTLLFHITEKVATPTSVVMMALNTSIAFFWRHLMMGDVSTDAWEFLAVCVPIVVLFAPFGSFLASHFHRLVLAFMIYILETVSLVSGFAIVRPGWQLATVSVGIIVVSAALFVGMTKLGRREIERVQNRKQVTKL